MYTVLAHSVRSWKIYVCKSRHESWQAFSLASSFVATSLRQRHSYNSVAMMALCWWCLHGSSYWAIAHDCHGNYMASVMEYLVQCRSLIGASGITQPSHLTIWRSLRQLKLRQMSYSKMASRSQMHNNLLPQGRSLQAVTLKTCLGPPLLVWSISRQPESMKSQTTHGNKMVRRTAW